MTSTENSIVRSTTDAWPTGHTLITLLVVSTFVVALWMMVRVEVTELPRIQQVSTQLWSELPGEVRDDWQTLTLPSRLCRVENDPCYDVFRAHFDHTADTMAVYVPRFVGTLRVRLNGEDLEDYGDLLNPVDLHFTPRLTRLPQILLRPTGNTLDLIATNEPGRYHQVNAFYIGAEAKLRSTFAISDYIANDVPVISIGIYLVLGLLSLSVFVFGGRDPVFGWFVLITVFSSLRSLYFTGLLVDPEIVRGGLYFFGSFCSLAVIFTFSRCIAKPVNTRLDDRWIVVAALLLSGIATIWDALEPATGNWVTNMAVRVTALLLGSGVMFYLYRYFRTEQHVVKMWAMGLFVAAFALVLHDMLPAFFGHYITVQMSN